MDVKIKKFLDETELVDGHKHQLLIEMRKLVFASYPNIEEKFMYGGIVFFDNSEMISGVFAFKNHVTIEFSNGFSMKDPNNHLEGSGKFRRHLKLKALEDVKNKEVAFYIKQAT